jgi:hypothetical protein
VPEIRSLLAGAESQASDLLQTLHRPEKAKRAFRRGADLGERLAAKGLISWETAEDIADKPSGMQKNSTPSLTPRQAVALLEAIPTDRGYSCFLPVGRTAGGLRQRAFFANITS